MSSSVVVVLAVTIAAFGVAYLIGRLLTLRSGMLRDAKAAADVDTSDMGLSTTVGPVVDNPISEVSTNCHRWPTSSSTLTPIRR